MTSAPTAEPKRESAPAGAREDQYRSFEWFAPKRRRATVYEDVSVDTQPSVLRYWRGPYPKYFPDGRPTWSEQSTRLRSTDWYAFRDPHGDWERTYYLQGRTLERSIENACDQALADRVYDDFPESWVEFLRANLEVLAFVDYGLWLPIAAAQRDCLSDTVAHAVGFEAGMKQRQFQAILLYGMELDEYFGEFTVGNAKQRFLEYEAFQPVRRFVERLRSVPDWAEQIVAVNACFEPTVGALLRRELMMRSAAANGDTVTTEIMRAAQIESSVVRGWTEELLRFVLDDPQHGTANREVLAEWLAEWQELADEAMAALRPLFDAAGRAGSYDASIARVQDDLTTLLSGAGLAKTEVSA